MKTLLRICGALNCGIADVIALEQDESPADIRLTLPEEAAIDTPPAETLCPKGGSMTVSPHLWTLCPASGRRAMKGDRK